MLQLRTLPGFDPLAVRARAKTYIVAGDTGTEIGNLGSVLPVVRRGDRLATASAGFCEDIVEQGSLA
jgi:hypothetical protein